MIAALAAGITLLCCVNVVSSSSASARLRGRRTKMHDGGWRKSHPVDSDARSLQAPPRPPPDDESQLFGVEEGYAAEFSTDDEVGKNLGASSGGYGDYGAWGAGSSLGNDMNTMQTTSGAGGSSASYGNSFEGSSSFGSNAGGSGFSSGVEGSSYGGSSSAYDYGTPSEGGSSSYESPFAPSASSTGYDWASGSKYGGSGASSSYASTWGSGSASAKDSPLSKFHAPSVQISLVPALFLLIFLSLTGMITTAHFMEHHSEGNVANCCRVILHTVHCIWKVVYNLYHCRLGDIPQVVFASELEEEDFTDEELERMTLRPGIERALDVEHRKALRKVGIEMNKIKVKGKKKSGQSGPR
mmetsp:Transcript_8439/g.19817  ORF Transcript_8439/g.19817 Transcript_8439/m.19817 type:complete len:356 (+) Transcript_8439:127-1194(+)